MNHSLPVRKILFLAANPTDTGRLRLDEEIREIEEGLKRSPGRETFELVAKWAIRIKDLRRALLEYQPHIVHFSGHGAGDDGLVLENEVGQATFIKAETLKRYFRLCPNVECVLLNACYSQVQADAIATHVPYVIGMNQAIGDNTAIQFAVGFYDALGHQRSVPDAYEWGITAIDAEPVVIQRNIAAYPESLNPQGIDPVKPILIAAQTQKKPVVSISKQDYRNRQALLNKARNYWIKGVLEHSLYNQVLIELGLEERLDFADPFHVTLDIGEQSHKALAPDVNIADVFDELGEGRTLLILGEPGSGKTITLLQLARDLVTKAEQDVNHLIPVVFNLSSWTGQQSIADWLVEELNTKYQVPKAIGKSWIQQQQLLLLLDGLDEVAAKHREACVVALNQFQQILSTEMVVCSRIRDYEALSQRLTVQQAVYVRSLNPTQIDHYLNSLNADLIGLRQLLKTDTALQELAQSPLILNIMILAYEGVLLENRPETTVETHRQQLFNAYIDRMFKRHQGTTQYSREQTIRWLNWLAQQMVSCSQTIFLIEWLDRSWLQTSKQRWGYIVLSSIIVGLAWSSIVSLSVGLARNWLLIALVTWTLYSSLNIPMVWATLMIERMKPNPRQVLLQRSIGSFWTGLIGGSMFGMVTGVSRTLQEGFVVAGLTIPLTILLDWQMGGTMGMSFLKPIESLQWSWPNVGKHLAFGLISSIPIGAFLGRANIIGQGMLEGILIFMLGGSIFGLITGLRAEAAIEIHTTPNQGIWQSAKTSTFIAIFVSIGLGLAIYLLKQWLIISLEWGIFCGLFIGLLMGGTACIVHFSLRLVFYVQKQTPWNYARFLDYAVRHVFLQKVGGGYIFIHRSLMEHFAQMDVAEK